MKQLREGNVIPTSNPTSLGANLEGNKNGIESFLQAILLNKQNSLYLPIP